VTEANVTIKTSAPLMSAILRLDASTFQNLAMITTDVPLTIAMLKKDAFMLERPVTTELIALLTIAIQRPEDAFMIRTTPSVSLPIHALVEYVTQTDVSIKLTRRTVTHQLHQNVFANQNHAKLLLAIMTRTSKHLAPTRIKTVAMELHVPKILATKIPENVSTENCLSQNAHLHSARPLLIAQHGLFPNNLLPNAWLLHVTKLLEFVNLLKLPTEIAFHLKNARNLALQETLAMLELMQ